MNQFSGRGRPPANRLVAAEVAREVAALLWSQRDHVLRVAVAPIVAAFAIGVWMESALPEAPMEIPAEGGEQPDPGWMLTWLLGVFLGVFPLTLFSVNCQRLALLGPSGVAGLGLRWGFRETRYLATAVVISLIAGFAVALPATLVSVVVLQAAQPPGLLLALMLPFYLYLVLRFSFALTAAALDQPGFIGWSWRETRGIGVQFLFTAALIVLPLEIGVLLFSQLLAATGLYAVAPFASQFLTTLAAYLPAAAMSVTIALVYRRLQGHSLATVV